MILHTVNQPPTSNAALDQCLSAISAPACLLLIEDGAYAATAALASRFEQLDSRIECYVLRPDLEARGLTADTNPRFRPVDDEGFVELSLACDKMVAWY